MATGSGKPVARGGNQQECISAISRTAPLFSLAAPPALNHLSGSQCDGFEQRTPLVRTPSTHHLAKLHQPWRYLLPVAE